MRKIIGFVVRVNKALGSMRCWLLGVLRRTEFLGTLVMLVKLVNEIKKFLGY